MGTWVWVGQVQVDSKSPAENPHSWPGFGRFFQASRSQNITHHHCPLPPPHLPSSICMISFMFIGLNMYSLNLGFPFPKKDLQTLLVYWQNQKRSIHNANSTIEDDKRITYQTRERRVHSRSPKQGHHPHQACLLYEVNWTVHSCLHGAQMTSVRARRGRYALSMQKA